MGLDAIVYCDCFERGRLRAVPRAEWGVHIYEDGGRYRSNNNIGENMAFIAWDLEACEHEQGILLHHRLGNIAMIGLLRQVLKPHADRLPVIVNKIIYNGVHAGDFLTLDFVEQLGTEVEFLGQIHNKNSDDEKLLRHFELQLRELVECARKVGKPIVF